MGLIECLPDHSRIVYTPHPVTCEGQRNFAAPLVKGETLGQFLRREVPDWAGDAWEVRINGVQVPYELMDRVRPKDGTLIEVRGAAKKQALYIVAMIALTYFTFGIGTAAVGAGGAAAAGAGYVAATYGALAAAAVFIGGSILINKVLGPKPASAGGQADQNTVFSIGASRNQPRQHQPFALTFGTVKFAPDILSLPYTWYEGDDQYLGMVLTPGIGVHSVEALTNGDAPLSAFQGVQVYHAGFPGMPEQVIPLYSDANTIQGGELSKERTWVQRATPPRTVRIQINLEYILGDQTSKGKPYTNVETVEAQYRVTGATNWMPLVSRNFANSSYDPKRATIASDVPEGQYDVRVRILGRAQTAEGENGRAQFQWTTMTAVQADTATYAGIPRIGVRIKATGQLNGAPDELRCVAHSFPIPVWKGPIIGWVTEETSNPGAQILAYSRGINDQNGERIAGIGLPDDMIDIAALQAFMLHCAANQFEYNYVIKDARSHDEMVNSLAAAGFGQVTWAGGRLSVVWAAADQPLSGVVNMATIKKGEFQVDYTLANAADGVEVTYFDVEAWETRTLRIPAPGVTTMLNPAQIALEGVGHEWHAAMLGRWHLAQSLYQYKDISYATDIEHLSYQRLSLLSLSHDLTQWGFSGRLRGASTTGGIVTLLLDEPVRQPPPGGAYVGLRIPGERTYRVFGVQPFEGESSTLTLTGAWPADAPLPGNSDANPAWDTLWCYDFKATPGYRVRVVAIEPESDLKGARVAVVPEGPEFWNYVLTGEYIPAPNQSLLRTRPVASNLKVSERQVVQGDTVFTELVAIFDLTGPVGDTVVQMTNESGELEEVARTTTRTAAWRITGPGTYQVVVRPISPDGVPGIAAGTVYSTIVAGAPPVLVDLFDVVERSGGVRLYTWGWFNEPPPDYVPPETPPGIEPPKWYPTTRSADFAGVEIRYIEGEIPAPSWEEMTPLVEEGYHSAPFEAVVPQAGTWTFACRSRNTSGDLSTDMRVIVRTLAANLGEQLAGIDERIAGVENIRDEMLADFEEMQQEVDAIRETADQAVSQLDALAAELRSEVDALVAQLGDIINADVHSPGKAYPAGDLVQSGGKLYRAKQNVPAGIAITNATYWQLMGDYASLGEAVASNLQETSTLATQAATQAQSLTLLGARNAQNTAFVLNQNTVRVDATTTLAQWRASLQSTFEGLNGRIDTEASASTSRDNAQVLRISTMEARMSGTTGALATLARVNEAETAAASATGAVAQRTSNIEARMQGTTGALATQASVNQVSQASVDGDQALASQISTVDSKASTASSNATQALQTANTTATSLLSVSSRIGQSPDNLVKRSSFSSGGVGAWSPGTVISVSPTTVPGGGDTGALSANGSYEVGNEFPASAGEQFDVSFVSTPNGGVGLHCMAENGSTTGFVVAYRGSGSGFQAHTGRITPPNGTTKAQPFINSANGTTAAYMRIRIDRVSEGVKQVAAVTQQLQTSVDTLNGWANARYSLSVTAGGDVAGMQLLAGGGVSAVRFLSSAFSVVNPAGTAGLQWVNGNLWNQRGSYSFLTGPDLGENMMVYIGPTPSSPQAAQKAQAMFYVDTSGVGYFAGQVLSGVIRGFNSSTTVGVATVATQTLSSNNKPVAVEAKFKYTASQAYLGNSSQIALGSGATIANVIVERRYRNAADTAWEGYVQLANEDVVGSVSVQNESDGPSLIRWNIQGSILATDPASLRKREYRVRVPSILLQNHTVTNPGTTPARVANQYQSIESME